VCIGKIASIYDSAGVTQDLTAKNNEQSIDQTIRALRDNTRGLIFSNLVDFDMLYGHRRDTEGYARALEHFDSRWPEIEAAMNEDDLVIITADLTIPTEQSVGAHGSNNLAQESSCPRPDETRSSVRSSARCLHNELRVPIDGRSARFAESDERSVFRAVWICSRIS